MVCGWYVEGGRVEVEGVGEGEGGGGDGWGDEWGVGGGGEEGIRC